MAFRYDGEFDINFQLKGGEKTNLKEDNGNQFTDSQMPDNLKRVVVCFYSDDHPCFQGIAFYDKQGTELLSVGQIENPVETILDDDERIVGIASRNDDDADHYDFQWIIAKKPQ